MKKIFILILGVSFLSSLSAQTYCEDFEGFTIGDPIGESSSVWTTWAANINPGLNPPYSDDVIVDGTQANSGNNSLYLSDATGNGGPQDILLPLGGVWDLGQFELTMQMYVSNGTGAYFNFQEEAIAGQSWAMDCMLDNQGNMTFSNGGGATTFLTTTYPFDTWFEIKMEIDLTTNYWEVFIDSVSQGYFSNPINQIASLKSGISELQSRLDLKNDSVMEEIDALFEKRLAKEQEKRRASIKKSQEKKAKDDRMTNGVMLVVALWLIIAKPALAAAILLFGVLVAIHEAGHMILAKWSGMRVDRFSIGMGPALYSFKRGETEYVLAPLPLGGYVHIAGLDPEEEGAANDPRAFDNRPLFGRVMAILGGPLANYISAAFLVFLLAFGLGGRWAVGIGQVMEGKPAAAAGLQAGDRTLAVDGAGNLVARGKLGLFMVARHEKLT